MKKILAYLSAFQKKVKFFLIPKKREISLSNLLNNKNGIMAVGIVGGLILVYFFLLRGGGAAASWWNDRWTYRKIVTISNSTTALTDYQAMITLDTATLVSAGKMQSDCDDIRIVGQNGEHYNYWIEPSTCNTSTTKIWVKVKSIPSTGGIVYIYYGNTGAGSVAKSPSEIFIREIDNVGAAWLLDESSANSCAGGVNDSCDSSSGNYDLGWGTATTSTTAKVANGLSFDGTDNATASIDNSFTPVSSSKRWAVAMWFKTSDTQGYLFDSGDGSNSGERVAVFTDGANNLSLYMSENSNGTEYKYLNYSVTSTDNNWHHLVVTRDGDNSVKLYVDGNAIGVSFTTTDEDMSSYSETWTDFMLGHRYTMHIYNYTGLIDEARVYTNSLTSAEITALYGDGTNRHGYVTSNYPNKELVRQYSANVSVGFPSSEEVGPGTVAYWRFDEGYGTNVNDSSGNTHTGTLGTGSSAPAWQSSEYCVSGNCLRFDGTDDAVNYGDILDFTGNTEMTVSAWVKMTSVPSGRAEVISKYDAGTAGQWYLGIDGNQKVTFLRECGNYGETGITPVVLNTWNHIAGVYDGSNIQVYLNGVLDKTAVDSCSISNTSVDVVIGAGDNGTGTEDHFSGFIDEVKVYPYARTADEINQDYFLASAEGASAVLGADNTASLSNGLVGYWDMEGIGTTGTGVSLSDKSGSGNTGTTAGGASMNCTVAGKYGGGCDFDGTDDSANLGSGATLDDLAGDSFSAHAWVYLDTAPASNDQQMVIISKGDSTDFKWHLSVRNNSGSTQYNATLNNVAISRSSDTTIVGGWHQVVITYNNATDRKIKMYVDGTEVSYATQIPMSGSYSSDASKNLTIGSHANGASYWDGKLDEVRIYNRALSSAEIKSLYQWAPGPVAYYSGDEGTGTSLYDRSGNANTGTLGTGASAPSWTAGKFGKALKFDGTDDYVTIPTSANFDFGAGDFTFGMWLKTTQDCSGNKVYFGRYTSDETYWIGCASSNNSITLNARDSNDVTTSATGTTAVNDGDWHYIAGVKNGNTLSVYIDGIFEKSATASYTGNWNFNPAVDSVIGGKYANSYYSEAVLDEIRIYNYARTPSQLIEDMNAGHPAVGTPVGSTILHLRMDEGYGTSVNDSSPQGNNGTISGATWTNEGKFGKALSFDGINDYIDLTNATNLKTYTYDQFTLSAWYKSTDTEVSDDEYIYVHYDSGGDWLQFGPTDDPGYTDRLRITIDVAGGGAALYYGTSDIVDQSWHHLVATRTNSHVYIYVDGKLESTIADVDSGSTIPIAATAGPYIGDHPGNTEQVHGILDEVKIYPFALSSDQVKLDYQGGKSIVLGATNTGVGGSSPSNSAGREYCVPGDSTACTAPVLELNFEEYTGTIANDTSTNGNSGTLTNGPSWKPSSQCKSGSCLEYNGTDEYVNIKTTNGLSSFSNPQTTYTLEAWVKTIYSGSTKIIYSNTTEDGWHRIALNGSGQAVMRIRDSGWGATSVTGTSAINDGQWHHVAGVFDNPTMSIYVDGVLENTATFSGSLLSSGGWAGGGVRVGVYYLPDGGYFNGHIDSVRVYNYARTPAQIAWDMNKGAPIAHYRFDECQGTTVHDVTGNGHNATMSIGGSGTSSVGTCSTSSSAWGNGSTGKWNASLDLDGSDDYLATGTTVPSLANVAEMSACAWIKYGPSSVSADGVIVGQYSGSPPGWLLWVDNEAAVSGRTDTVAFSINPAGGTSGRVEGTTGLVTSGAWDHYCGVFKGSSFIRLYKNGVLNTENTSSIVSTTDVPNTVLQMGRWTNFDNSYFDGQIDDVRIYNYALTPHQVKELYSGGSVVFK